jgi:hypothetical protein
MENFDKLDLIELRTLCKKYEIGVVGEKKDLIKKLKYFLDPVEGTLNTHPNRKVPDNKKIVGTKEGEKEKLNLILKNKGQFLYYSFGFKYYVVDKDLDL